MLSSGNRATSASETRSPETALDLPRYGEIQPGTTQQHGRLGPFFAFAERRSVNPLLTGDETLRPVQQHDIKILRGQRLEALKRGGLNLHKVRFQARLKLRRAVANVEDTQ